MTRWKKVLPLVLGTLALTVVATGYGLVHSKDSPASTPAKAPRRPLGCRLSLGEELGFRVHASSDGKKPETPAPERMSLDGEMWWRVLEGQASSGWVVAATLNDVRTEGARGPSSDADLEAPFLVRVGRDCSFREFAFDPTTQEETRKQLSGLVRGMEIILSPIPSAQWVSRHHDAVGAFDATYKISPEQDEDGVVLTRKRTRYDNKSLPALPAALGGKLRVDVLASDAHVVLDSEGQWLHALEGDEKIRIRMGERIVTELSTTVELSRIEEGGAPASLAAVDTNRFAWGETAPAANERTSDEPPPVDPALAALAVDGALDDFAARLGSGSNGLHDATRRLAGYFAAHPEAIKEVLDRMRQGKLDENLHAPLFLALEKTGTPAAARALEGALSDRGMAVQDRMRAAAALQDIPRPSEQTANVLIEEARAGRRDASEKPVARSALLALGALSDRTEKKQPEVSRLAKEAIGDSLNNAKGEEDVTVALDAIGNAGDASFAESLSRYTTDPSAMVRAHAAQAYRGMDRATMEPVLVDWLGTEDDAVVRRAIASSLHEKITSDGVPASAAVLAAAMSRLPLETDALARGALIALIGSAAATDTNAKRALVEHFPRETVADLKVLIGQFVGAADLR